MKYADMLCDVESCEEPVYDKIGWFFLCEYHVADSYEILQRAAEFERTHARELALKEASNV